MVDSSSPLKSILSGGRRGAVACQLTELIQSCGSRRARANVAHSNGGGGIGTVVSACVARALLVAVCPMVVESPQRMVVGGRRHERCAMKPSRAHVRTLRASKDPTLSSRTHTPRSYNCHAYFGRLRNPWRNCPSAETRAREHSLIRHRTSRV